MVSGQDRRRVSISPQYNDSRHWKEIFDKYDLDGNGKISYNELKEMLRSSNYTNDIPPRVVGRIMQKTDLDGSGYLEYPEFIAMINKEDMSSIFGYSIRRFLHGMVSQLAAISGTDTLGEYEDGYRCRPPPVAMIIISIIQIISYVYDIVNPSEEQSSNNSNDYFVGPAAELLIYDHRKRYEVWRYLTYMFVHNGILHLSSNLLVQIVLGIPLEMVHKWWRVLIIYFAGVAAGSLGISVSNPSINLLGASGGVYALITAYVATLIMNWHQMEFAVLQLCVFVIITILNVGLVLYNVLCESDQHIAHVAHLTGAIAGLLVGITVLRNLEVRKWEKVVWWASISTYIALMTAAIMWNIFGME